VPNFFLDNNDIQFHLDHLDLREIVELREDAYAEHGRFPYAPEDYEDALDSYRKALEVVGDIAGEFIAPRAPDVDQIGAQLHDGQVSYPPPMQECIDRLAAADLMGFTLPRPYGGLNMPTILYTMAIEIVSRADAALMTIFGLQDIAETINDYGSDEQKQQYLPRFASGEATGAMALTEPDAGSDLQAVRLTAHQADDGTWRLSGVKRFITNGCGDILLVLARSEPGTVDGRGLSMFIAEKGPDIQVRRIEDKLGIHGSPTCELQFNDAVAYLVGQRRRGLTRYVMSLMNGARLGIAAQALGIAEAAYREALVYARDRVQFGKPILDFPAVYDLIASMRMGIEGARALIYDTALTVDMEKELTRQVDAMSRDDDRRRPTALRQKRFANEAKTLTPMGKYYVTELANRVASDAIQVHGGCGYMRDFPVERLFRDARIANIYEGTSQLQVVAALGGVLSGHLDDRFAQARARTYAGGLAPLADVAAHALDNLHHGIEHMKEQDDAYRDYYARRLVDMAIDVHIAYLLLRDAERSEAKKLMARRFIADMGPRSDMNLAYIISGETTTIEHRDALV